MYSEFAVGSLLECCIMRDSHYLSPSVLFLCYAILSPHSGNIQSQVYPQPVFNFSFSGTVFCVNCYFAKQSGVLGWPSGRPSGWLLVGPWLDLGWPLVGPWSALGQPLVGPGRSPVKSTGFSGSSGFSGSVSFYTKNSQFLIQVVARCVLLLGPKFQSPLKF